jgi:hypothetical protein
MGMREGRRMRVSRSARTWTRIADKRLSDAAVATSREGRRSPRSGRAPSHPAYPHRKHGKHGKHDQVSNSSAALEPASNAATTSNAAATTKTVTQTRYPVNSCKHNGLTLLYVCFAMFVLPQVS